MAVCHLRMSHRIYGQSNKETHLSALEFVRQVQADAKWHLWSVATAIEDARQSNASRLMQHFLL